MATENSASETAKTEVAKEQEQSSVTVSRRKALSAMVATGAVAGLALPEKWKKPVVNAVVLPAHAQASLGSSFDILASYISSTNGHLYVLAQGNLTPACVQAAGDPPPDDYSDFQHALIHNGTTLQFEFSAAPQDCTSPSALISGCIISASVVINSAAHSVTQGDTITMRFEYGGTCITSVVATVS